MKRIIIYSLMLILTFSYAPDSSISDCLGCGQQTILTDAEVDALRASFFNYLVVPETLA